MSKIINIMTWNVDWFRNGKRTGKPKEYFERDSSKEIYNPIINKIKNYLENENAIVFLQEVPYKVKSNRWHQHFLYDQLIKDFPLDEYDVFVNKSVNNGFFYRCTIAIAAKDNFSLLQSNYLRNNRTIAVQAHNCIFIGVHMPTQFTKEDENCEIWNNIIEFIKTNGQTSNIVLAGDFNTYIGCQDKLTEEKYLELLNYMGNCVSESIITFGKTSIDKFLISKNNIRNINHYVIQVQHDCEVNLSDHKYICMEISVE